MTEPVVAHHQPFVVNEDDVETERWDDPVKGIVQWRTLLSADRTPTSTMTVGVATLEPGAADEFHPHRHSDAEVYYILEGSGLVEIDGAQHAVRAGTAVFIPGDAWHSAINTGTTVMRLLYVFAVDSFDQVGYVFPE